MKAISGRYLRNHSLKIFRRLNGRRLVGIHSLVLGAISLLLGLTFPTTASGPLLETSTATSETSIVSLFGNGQDGPLVISEDTLDDPVDAVCTGTEGEYSLAAENPLFASGQAVFIHQTRGSGSAGFYEINLIRSYTDGHITLFSPLKYTYLSGAQVLVMRQYTSVTVNSGAVWLAKAWNGSTGGILPFLVTGQLTVNGTLSAAGRGFRGGQGVSGETSGYQGESYSGLGVQGEYLANETAGGAGLVWSNCSSGGGGGGHSNNGDSGITFGNYSLGGQGGKPVGTSDLSVIFLGGGGGSGSSGQSIGVSEAGGAGGGIIYFTTPLLVNNGRVSANGNQGGSGSAYGGAGSGGGAGGSILMKCLGWKNYGSLSATGGNAGVHFGSANECKDGGDGSNGRLFLKHGTLVLGTTEPDLSKNLLFLPLSCEPGYNRLDVAVDDSIDIVFSRELDSDTVNEVGLIVCGAQSGRIGGTITVSGDTASFTPDTPFRSGETFRVTLTGDVQDTSGTGLELPQSWQFTAAVNGTGAHCYHRAAVAGSGSLCAASGDLDNDGDLDLVNSSGSGLNRLFLNDGSGLDWTVLAWGDDALPALAVALGDLDNDADLDIAAGDNGQNRIYLNKDNGSHWIETAFGPAGYSSRCLALGDLDNDADLDIVAGFDGRPDTVYLNDGSGTLWTDIELSLDVRNTKTLALGDLDNDGDPDIFASGENGVDRIYFNCGNGLVWVPVELTGCDRAATLGDLDNDGDLDIAAGDAAAGIEVLFNDGTGQNWTTLNLENGNDNLTALAAGDLDGDGDLDIAATYAAVTSTGESDSAATSASESATTGYSAAGYSAESGLVLWLNEGSGRVWSKVNWGPADSLDTLALGDIDGDGDLDIAVGGEESGPVVYRNDNVGPEMRLEGNSQEISSGSLQPDQSHHTDFGKVALESGEASRTFTILNQGDTPLRLEGSPVVEITGEAAGAYRLTASPLASIPAGSSSNFTLTFDPDVRGACPAIVAIHGNDPDESPYTFAVSGRGAAALSVNGITAGDKEYDGSPAASINPDQAVLEGLGTGDNVTLSLFSPSGSFPDKSVGENRPVLISGLEISGPDVDNYTLTPVYATASITPRDLTVAGITVADKTYDGLTGAVVNTYSAVLQGVVAGDNVTLECGAVTAAFLDPAVGSGKTVLISGLALAGADAPNYRLDQPTATASIKSRSSGGGGGGGGSTTSSTARTLNLNLLGKQSALNLNDSGLLQSDVSLLSTDGDLEIFLSAGARILVNGSVPAGLSVAVDTEVPAVKPGTRLIGRSFDCGPVGALFEPALTVVFHYDPEILGEDIEETDLYAAWLDDQSGLWTALESRVDRTAHTLTARVPHFSTLALLAPTAAQFTFSDLSVSPPSDTAEKVKISVTAHNSGGKSGTCPVELFLNEVLKQSDRVVIEPGGSREVGFEISGLPPGEYSVRIEALRGAFTITLPKPAAVTPAVTENPARTTVSPESAGQQIKNTPADAIPGTTAGQDSVSSPAGEFRMGYLIGLLALLLVLGGGGYYLWFRRQLARRVYHYQSLTAGYIEEGYSLTRFNAALSARWKALGRSWRPARLRTADAELKNLEDAVQRLRDGAQELDRLNPGSAWAEQVESIRDKLRDPSQVEAAELELNELRQLMSRPAVAQPLNGNTLEYAEAVDERTFPVLLEPQYHDISFIGRGGFAKVFAASRRTDERRVAVKIPWNQDRTTGRAFLREIYAWQHLKHPNIAELLDFNVMPLPYLEMELCEKSLNDLEKPVDLVLSLHLLYDIAEGVKFAHSRDIIHRDLKPGNILLTGMTPKVSDWGMSKSLSAENTVTTHVMTLKYAAPEQLNPAHYGQPDQRTDIYQLGIIFYELVTGKLPFQSDNLVELLFQIIAHQPEPVSRLRPAAADLEPLINRCLAVDPDERFQSVQELQAALSEFLEQDPE